MPQASGSPETVIEMNLALYGAGPDSAAYASQIAEVGPNNANLAAYANQITESPFVRVPDSTLASTVLNNMLGSDPANSVPLQAAVVDLFAANPSNRGVLIYQLSELLESLEGNAIYGAAALSWNTRIDNIYGHPTPVSAATTADPKVAVDPKIVVPVPPLGPNYVLTNKVETLTGTAGDDTFIGTEATLNAGDTLVGGDGNDSLRIATSGTAPVNLTGFSTSSIETALFTSDAEGGTSLDLSGMVGTTALVNDNSSTNLSFDNLPSLLSLTVQNVSGGDTLVSYIGNAATGDSDTLAMAVRNNKTLTGGSIGAIQADGIETFNITTSNGSSNIAELKSNALKTVLIAGDQNLTLHALHFAGGSSANNLDAAALTGKLDLTLGSNTVATLVNGGKNTDTLRFSGNLADYHVTITPGASTGATVHDLRLTLLPVGDVSENNVERLAFNDQGLALDMAATQSGGKTVLALATALGASTLGDHTWAAKALAFFDSGASLQDAATLLVSSGMLAALAGGSDNTSLVRLVYQNVFGSPPDAGTLAQLQAPLDNHSLTQAQWLTAVEQIGVVQQQVHLAGYAQTGLQFAL